MNKPIHSLCWDDILNLLPEDLNKLAIITGAVQRWRKIRDGVMLLWMCFAYSQAFSSLRMVSALSLGFGNGGLKDTSVQYRLRNAAPFLGAILAHQLSQFQERLDDLKLRCTLRIQDATCLSVPGSKGTDWRLHTVFVPSKGLASVEITDVSGAESLTRGNYKPNDIVLADQGLGRAKDLHHVRNVGAFSLVRVYLQNIALLMQNKSRLAIVSVLDAADSGQICAQVLVPFAGNLLPARLIVVPLPEDKAAIARKKLRRRASKKQTKHPTEIAVRLVGYCALLTTIPEEFLPDASVLSLYRIRWQIELLFKRWKSLLHLDKLRCDDPGLVRTFCLSKLIEAAVLDHYTATAQKFYSDCAPDSLLCADSIPADETIRPHCSTWRIFSFFQCFFQHALLNTYQVPSLYSFRILDALREGKRKRTDTTAKILSIHRQLNPLLAAA